MSTENTQFSPSAWALSKSIETFALNKEEDSNAAFAAKVIGRALTNAAIATAALTETFVLALVTSLSSTILSFASMKTAEELVSRTNLAGRTSINAFKAIAGYGLEKEEKKEIVADAEQEKPAAAAAAEQTEEAPAPTTDPTSAAQILPAVEVVLTNDGEDAQVETSKAAPASSWVPSTTTTIGLVAVGALAWYSGFNPLNVIGY